MTHRRGKARTDAPTDIYIRGTSGANSYVSRGAARRALRRRRSTWLMAGLLAAGVVVTGVFWLATGAMGGRGGMNTQSDTPSIVSNDTSPTPAVTTPPQNPTSTAATATAELPPAITVNAVGDIAFVSSVDRLMSQSGATAPVDGVAAYLKDADLTVANLETALSTRGTAVPGKTFTFRSNPSRAVSALKAAGVDLVSLANNHTRDWGGDALEDTLTTLNDASISWAGAGMSADEAFAPKVIKTHGATVAYLAYSQIGPADFVATDSRSGTAFTVDLSDVRSAVRRAHKKADYVIVSFHWGVEKSYSPNDRQVKFGQAAIDAGADAVIAHHPHVLQGVEFYKDGLIAYSLGNFVFSPGSSAGRDTMILSFTLSPEGVSEAKARAAYIHPSGATQLAEGSTGRRITSLTAETSSERGTTASIGSDGQTVTLTTTRN